MCVVCKSPSNPGFAGANPQTVTREYWILPITAQEQRENYEVAKMRIIDRGESTWLCNKHLDNYRQVVEALEAHHNAKWGNPNA